MPQAQELRLQDGAFRAPLVGRWHSALTTGQVVKAGQHVGWIEQGVKRTMLRIDATLKGNYAVIEAAENGFVDFERVLLLVEKHTGAEDVADDAGVADDDQPLDAVPVRAATEGIFYRRPSPDAPAYADIGARVEINQTLGLVEVMKTFGPCRSPLTGTLVRFEVEEGEAVSQGQIILWIQAE